MPSYLPGSIQWFFDFEGFDWTGTSFIANSRRLKVYRDTFIASQDVRETGLVPSRRLLEDRIEVLFRVLLANADLFQRVSGPPSNNAGRFWAEFASSLLQNEYLHSLSVAVMTRRFISGLVEARKRNKDNRTSSLAKTVDEWRRVEDLAVNIGPMLISISNNGEEEKQPVVHHLPDTDTPLPELRYWLQSQILHRRSGHDDDCANALLFGLPIGPYGPSSRQNQAPLQLAATGGECLHAGSLKDLADFAQHSFDLDATGLVAALATPWLTPDATRSADEFTTKCPRGGMGIALFLRRRPPLRSVQNEEETPQGPAPAPTVAAPPPPYEVEMVIFDAIGLVLAPVERAGRLKASLARLRAFREGALTVMRASFGDSLVRVWSGGDLDAMCRRVETAGDSVTMAARWVEDLVAGKMEMRNWDESLWREAGFQILL